MAPPIFQLVYSYVARRGQVPQGLDGHNPRGLIGAMPGTASAQAEGGTEAGAK